jgi:ribose transport system permease protein
MQKLLFALGVAEFYTNIFNGVIMVVAILFGNLSAIVTVRQRVGTGRQKNRQYAAQ